MNSTTLPLSLVGLIKAEMARFTACLEVFIDLDRMVQADGVFGESPEAAADVADAMRKAGTSLLRMSSLLDLIAITKREPAQ